MPALPVPAPVASEPVAAPPAPRPAAPKAATPPVQAEEPGLLASLMEHPMAMPGGIGLVVLLVGLAVYRLRGRFRKDNGETSFLESRLQPDSFFGASGGQRVDTRDAASGVSSSMSYSLSQLDAIGDVDPVAEADVYLAYGRDLQAEEILKEAMRGNPERMAIRTKLLEVYAKRRDTKGFELLATQLYSLTKGEGDDWAKAQELDVPVVMHPEDVAGADKMNPYGLKLICGNPADSALCFGFMTYSGVFDRFPKLKLCILHGGGFFPYHLGRFDQGWAVRAGARAAKAKMAPSGYLKNIYYDNMIYRLDTIKYLIGLGGIDHIMVGTDYPFDWPVGIDFILNASFLNNAQKTAILGGNLIKLLRITPS